MHSTHSLSAYSPRMPSSKLARDHFQKLCWSQRIVTVRVIKEAEICLMANALKTRVSDSFSKKTLQKMPKNKFDFPSEMKFATKFWQHFHIIKLGCLPLPLLLIHFYDANKHRKGKKNLMSRWSMLVGLLNDVGRSVVKTQLVFHSWNWCLLYDLSHRKWVGVFIRDCLRLREGWQSFLLWI